MLERGIVIDYLKKALRSPDAVEVLLGNRFLVRKTIETGKSIEVVYHKDPLRKKDEYLIITAYYL